MATILIIEDDRETNDAICEYLKSAGHSAFPSYDGGEALDTFAQRKIDLVVLDIMLPTITGLGVLHEIRKKALFLFLCLQLLKTNIRKLQVSMNKRITMLQNHFLWCCLADASRHFCAETEAPMFLIQ